MSEEKKKILEMLSEGKINVEQAEKLLNAVEPPEQPSKQHKKIKILKDGKIKGENFEPKYLRIMVDSTDGDEVNIKLPLGLIRAGLKLSAILPKNTEKQLSEKGIDIEQFATMESEELIKALNELEIKVNTADGDDVSIFAE